jgi:HAD superfamily hydrolase (TIGR01549 family)
MAPALAMPTADQDRACPPVAAWLVDLDGTLYHAAPVRLCLALELLLMGRQWLGAIRTFRQCHELLRSAQDGGREGPGERVPPGEGVPGSDPYRQQLAMTARRLGLDPAALEAGLAEWMQRRPGKWLALFRRRRLLAQIAAFRQQGGRTALVSDYPARLKLTALGAAALFDVVVASGEPGGPRRLKPDPHGYLLAAQRLGVPPAACLVIGDRDDADGEAARRAGMRFCRVGRSRYRAGGWTIETG